MNSGIYMILNKINFKPYIGSAVNIQQRWNYHKSTLNKNTHDNSHLQSAWNKYGPDKFMFIEVDHCPKEKLIEKEQEWLDRTKDYNYNICKIAGNTLGNTHTKETRLKISKAHIGMYASDKTKKKMSIAKSGENHPMFGKCGKLHWNYGQHTSDETKKKMSNVKIGKYCGRDNYMFGKYHSIETKKKISDALKGKYCGENSSMWGKKGKLSPNFGKHSSDETKKKMSDNRKGENNSNTKLTWKIVNEIRAYYKHGITRKKLCENYKISSCQCDNIINIKTWKI